MQVHHFGICTWRNDCGAHLAQWADGAKNIGGVMAVIAYHQWPGAAWRPDIGVAAFLADPRLVLEPDFYRRSSRAADECGVHQTGKVFLKVASASASFLG
jgi:hypothetical protein